MKYIKYLLLLLTLCSLPLYAGKVTRLTEWADGDVLGASALNAEFDNLLNTLNGSIGRANVDSSSLIVIDTLAIRRGLKMGNTHTATLGNVIWGNGSLFVPVSKDSAGIIDKTSRQTITGVKIFSDTVSIYGMVQITGEGTYSATQSFEVLPEAANLFPTLMWQLTNKWYVDSLHAINRDSIAVHGPNIAANTSGLETARDSVQSLQSDVGTLDTGQLIARDSIQVLQDSVTSAQDTLAAVKSRLAASDVTVLTARVDSLYLITGVAGEITSPGHFMMLDTTDGKWYKADISPNVKASGVAVDSVGADAAVKIQTGGIASFAWWNGLITAYREVVSDSATAGSVATTDPLRTNTKKMQVYGLALDSITVRLNLGEVWVWQE